MEYQLKTRQVCFFFIAFLPVIKLFSLPSVLASACEEDMWISALVSLTLDLLTVSVVLLACKKANTDFYTLLERNLGKVLSKIVLSLYVAVLIIKALVPINQQKNFVDLTLYETLPSIFNFLPFFAVSFYLCIKGLRVLGRCADLIWVCTAVGIVLIFTLSITNCDFSAVLPIGAQGANKILTGTFRASTWFGDCVYLLFFLGRFKYSKKDGIKIVLSYALSGISVVLFMVLFYGVFTSIAHRQTFALTEITQYAIVVNNIGRFDYLGIMFILLSNFFALSLPLYFATEILQRICSFKRSWISALIINGAVLAFITFFGEFFASVETFTNTIGNGLFIVLFNILPCFIAVFKKERINEVQAR